MTDTNASPPASALAIPQGWKLVPIEPTPEMIEAADAKDDLGSAVFGEPDFPASHPVAYRAMVEAAPLMPTDTEFTGYMAMIVDETGKVLAASGDPVEQAMVDHMLKAAPPALADASGEVERVREAAAKCDPVLRDKPSVKVMAGLLKLGAEHQRPRSKQYARGEHNAEADAEFIVAAINFARAALNLTAGAKR